MCTSTWRLEEKKLFDIEYDKILLSTVSSSVYQSISYYILRHCLKFSPWRKKQPKKGKVPEHEQQQDQ